MAVGNIKGKHAEVFGPQHVGYLKGVPKQLQMGGKRGGNLYFSNGRAHRPNVKPGIVQLLFDLLGLFHGYFGNVNGVHAPDLNARKAVSDHSRYLPVHAGRSLVGKTVYLDLCHILHSFFSWLTVLYNFFKNKYIAKFSKKTLTI